MARQFYLSREGKVFGPFSEEKIEEMRKGGELLSYLWIWDSDSQNWSATYTPPAPPIAPEVPAQGTPPSGSEPSQTGPAASAAPIPQEKLLVLCHDYRNVVNGKFTSLNQYGAWFLSNQPHKGLMPFRRGSTIWLNLLHEETGKTENLSVELAQATLDLQNLLKFELKWKKIPTLLQT